MNKVTLSLVALATLGGTAQVQAADLTPEEQKAEAIKAKKAAIDEVRIVLNAASVSIESDCPDVKDEFLLKLSKLTQELNDKYNDDKITEFDEAMKASYIGQIQEIKSQAVAKHALLKAKGELDSAYKTLKDQYDAAIVETGKYPNVGPGIKAELQKLNVEQVQKDIEAAYATGKIDQSTKAKIDGNMKTLSENIGKLIEDIEQAEKDYNNNEASYKAVIAAFDAAKAEYDTQLQDVIKALPTPTYENWQNAVVKDLNAQYRLLLDAKKKVEAAYAAGTAATQSTDLKAIIAGAESKIKTLVGNKKSEAEVEDAAKATADAKVKDLQTKLKGEKDKLAKYNLTDCDAAIAAVQKQIDDMQTDINDHYANGQNNVSKQDYVAMEGKINTAIGSIKSDDKYKKTVDEVVANKEAQLAMDSEVETLEKTLTTAIEKAKTASADKAYNAAAYFEASVKAINDNINKAKTAISGKFGTKEAAAYKASADYAQLVKTIKDGTTAYGTRTAASLDAYNKAVKTATDAQALLDKLVEKAKDTTVKVDATTYADKIASIKKDIKAINDAIATAKAKKDDAHRTAMESAASKTITEDIAKLTADYDAHKLTFDKENADNSAKAYITSAQNLIDAETAVLGKIGDPAKPEFAKKYGNQTDNIKTEFAKLQTELTNLTAKKNKAETDYNADMAAAGADETKLLNAAAKAIGVLADVNKDLDALKTKVEALDKVAEAAADNVVAYNETIKEVNSASAAKTTLDNYRAGLSITVDPAWTYYDNAMSDYILELAKVAEKVEAAYAAHTSRADQKSLLAEKDLILANAKALTEKVKPNQDAYTAQSQTIVAVKKEWQDAYDKVSNGDLSNKGPEFLSQLTKQQEAINKLAETAKAEFGKGAAVANNISFNDSVTNIRAKLNEITGQSQSDYAQNVNDQNDAQHEAFLSAFNLSSTAFTKSVNELNQFRTIQREDLRENALVTNELVTVHKNIYAYADKLRKLQKDELAKYNGFVAMDKKYGADDVFFDSKSYTDSANLYKSDIEKLLNEYEVKVNAYAESLIAADLAYAQSQLSTGQSAVAAFTYAGKAQAFDDLATLISKVTTSKSNGGTFAVQVDKQWLGDLAKANVDKMYNADVAAACTAEKATLVDAVTKVYNAEKDAIGKLADIDAKKYLADLDVLKSNTIDKGVKENPTLAAIPTIKSNCEAYIGTILANHSDVYANAVQASKDIAANNTAYAEITKNLEAADAVLAAAYKKLTQLYSLHVKNPATDALRSIELAYYAQVADAKKYNEEQSCVAHKDEFKDLAKVYQTMVDAMKGNLIDIEISDVRTKIVQVKEEYNLAVAAVGLDDKDLKKCKVEDLSKSLDAIEVNWNLPTSDKNKKSYDEIMKLLLDQEVTVADMYQALNGMYDNKKEKVAAATSEIEKLKTDVETKLGDAENMVAAYNEALAGKYKGLVEHLRTKFNSTVASYEAKQKAGQLLFFKDNFMFDFGVVQESLDKNNGRVAALKADYKKLHENDVAFETLKNGIDELNTQLAGFQEHIKDFVSLTEKEKTDEVSRLSTTISTMLSEITTAHDKIALPDASFTDDVAYVKGNILTIQTSWTNSEVPARLSAVKKDLEAALSSMTGKRYSPSTLTELNNSYAAIDKLLTAASEYNDDAVDGTIVKDIDGEVLKKAEVVDYLKVAWPLMVERINKLAADTKSFAERTVEASYIKGDARHDNNVDVNDYTYVRNWILADKTFKDVVAEFGEGAAYGGDVDESGDFTVADLARISNIIFYGNEAGPAATRARATRSVETDQITVAKQSEETTVFGKTVQLAINVTNNATFTAGQFDVTLPAGMKLVGQELTDRGNGHEILGSELSEGKYRILASTVENSAFTGHDGALVVLNVEVGSDYAGGNIEVSNAIFSDAEGHAYVITRGIGGGTGDTTGIDSITAPTMKERIYSIGGMVKKTVQKGINIIVGEDGTARKVVKK